MKDSDKAGVISCQNCQTSLSASPFFYTFATNGYMFGYFCCDDCAKASLYAPYFQKATVVRINASAASHKDLVLIPSLQSLKEFKQESERRELRKKYFG